MKKALKKKKKKKKKELEDYWEVEEEGEYPVHEKYVKPEHVKKA